jgi:phosphate transport system substrate-binding protein
LAISPNNKTAAVVLRRESSAPPELLLVDLTDKARTVTTVAPPPNIEIVVQGSDLALEAAKAWQESWTRNHSERRLRLRGGGSSEGMKALTNGSAHLAVTSRAVTPTEQLDIQCIVRDVVAVCVHPDNPLPAIGTVQLQRLFTDKADKQWSKHGVVIPDSDDTIETAMLLPGSPGYTPFRKAVLNNRSTANGHIIRNQPAELAEFVRTHRGALACMPLDAAHKLGASIRIVPVRNTGDVVMPTEAAIKDGSYPLTYSWYAVSRKKVEPRVRQFLNWLNTDAAKQATATSGRRPAK